MFSSLTIFSTDFFESTAGIIAVAVTAFLVLAVFAVNLRKKRIFNVKTLTYSAICIALAVLLSNVKLFKMPQGGSVTACSMLFIALVGYWFGPAAGILAGVTHGLVDLVMGPYVIHPAQLLLDYPLAFGIIGISGFFRNMKNGLYIGYAVGAAGRLFMTFLSGVIFFGSYAPEGMNVALYSFMYNASYIVPEMIITFLLISIPPFKSAINKQKAHIAN